MARGCLKFLRTLHAPKMLTDDTGKAKVFRLFSTARPHMRSFHASWFSFFVAFTSWFGIQPLLPTIRKELGLTKVDIANSGIASVAATICVRMMVGPFCDRFGPKRTMATLLLCGAIPMALSGLIKDATGLICLRLFVGILGGSFVPCQFWTTSMFNINVVGTANAMVGGWGNLGGGFTFIFMPAVFELVKLCGAHEFLAWKIAVAIPAFICVAIGISILFTTDDCPQGKWKDRRLLHVEQMMKDCYIGVDAKSEGTEIKEIKTDNKPMQSTKEVEVNDAKPSEETTTIDAYGNQSRVWNYITVFILVTQYAMSFGVELAVFTIINLYLLYKFKIDGCVENDLPPNVNSTMHLFKNSSFLSNNVTIPTVLSALDKGPNRCSILDQNTASLIASLFGLMNLFARALGGIFSDVLLKYHGIPGRLLALFICLACEGIMLLVFSQIETVMAAIFVITIFSTTVQMSEGAVFAVVPYVIPKRIGLVAGLVGGGGNAGALIWNTIWSKMVSIDPSGWFRILGIVIICGSFLNFISLVQGQRLWHVFLCKANKKSTSVR